MKRHITPQTLATIAVVVAAAVFAGFVAIQSSTTPETVAGSETQELLVRPDSHVLDEGANGKATIVEFLDFECEACRAAYPFVEDLRTQYDGKLTFVVRYFPLDSHQNSRNAAHAVEAAASQGQMEAMYRRMYETQPEWGEKSESQADVFRTFADDLGLDMEQFDRDVSSDTVADRVERDYQDGLALGVTGTPTFFLNGEMFQPSTTEEFSAAIDTALAS